MLRTCRKCLDLLVCLEESLRIEHCVRFAGIKLSVGDAHDLESGDSTYSLLVIRVNNELVASRHMLMAQDFGKVRLLRSARASLCFVCPESERFQLGTILSRGGVEVVIGSLRLISQCLPGTFACASLCMQLPYSRLAFLPFFFRYAGSLQAEVWFVGFVHPEIPSKSVIVEFPGSVPESAHCCGVAL